MVSPAIWSSFAALVSVLFGSARALGAGGGAAPGAGFTAGDLHWVALVAAPILAGLVFLYRFFLAPRIVHRSTRRAAASTDAALPDSPRPGTIIAVIALEALILGSLLPLAGALLVSPARTAVLWGLPVCGLPAAIVFAAGNKRALRQLSDPGQEVRRDRRAAWALAAAGVSGVIFGGLIFPAPGEIRLLGIAPAAIVALLGVAAPLHPDAATGRVLATRLSRVLFPSLLIPMALVSMFS